MKDAGRASSKREAAVSLSDIKSDRRKGCRYSGPKLLRIVAIKFSSLLRDCEEQSACHLIVHSGLDLNQFLPKIIQVASRGARFYQFLNSFYLSKRDNKAQCFAVLFKFLKFSANDSERA